MFDLALRFNTPGNLFIFLLLCAFFSFWAYLRFKMKSPLALAPVIAMNFILLFAWTWLFEIDHDMASHLHLSWLVSQGFIPYKDFWHNHPPFFWALLAPCIKAFEASVMIFDLSRIFSILVFLANVYMGWHVAKLAWKGKAELPIYLLVLSSAAITAELTFLKPDFFMIFFLLVGIRLSFEIPGKRVLPSFCAGVAFSIAASFIPKQYLLSLLPVLAVFLGEKRLRPAKLAAYCLGFVAGGVPLLSYLINRHILREYIFWVFLFNKRIIYFSLYYPVIIFALGLWGAYLLLKRFRQSREINSLIMFFAFCLCVLGSLATTFNNNVGHYLAFFIFVCAITASGCGATEALGKMRSLAKKSLVTGIVFSVLLVPNIARVWSCRGGDFQADKKAVAQLLQYCRNDTCVAIMPIHPVFARDATRLYSDWQYNHAGHFSWLADDARGGGIARRIMDSFPAVVNCRYRDRDFLLELFQRGLISAVEYKKLVQFVKENYTRQDIGKRSFYVRNDKIH